MPAPVTQALLLTCGVLPLLVFWDQRQHLTSLLWAIALTVCCWRISPGWATPAMLGLTAIAVILCARSFGKGRQRAQGCAPRAQEIERLAERARREQWTTIAVLPARHCAYAEPARLLASDRDRIPPPPPTEPRPGPSELWERLDDAHRVAAAAAVTTTAGLAKRGAQSYACRRLRPRPVSSPSESSASASRSARALGRATPRCRPDRDETSCCPAGCPAGRDGDRGCGGPGDRGDVRRLGGPDRDPTARVRSAAAGPHSWRAAAG